MAMKQVILSGKDRAEFMRAAKRVEKAYEEMGKLISELNGMVSSSLTALQHRVEALEQQRGKRTPARAPSKARKEG